MTKITKAQALLRLDEMRRELGEARHEAQKARSLAPHGCVALPVRDVVAMYRGAATPALRAVLQGALDRDAPGWREEWL